MSNVITIGGTAIDDGTGTPKSIEVLIGELIAESTVGEIQSMGVIVVRPNGAIGTKWAGVNGTRSKILAGTVYLQRDLMNAS